MPSRVTGRVRDSNPIHIMPAHRLCLTPKELRRMWTIPSLPQPTLSLMTQDSFNQLLTAANYVIV
uniref:Uncharacterized protein n=1 Tax=Romanomermis culicivorax TaxID=13658 RepID=A0A915JEJ4_ROMCU